MPTLQLRLEHDPQLRAAFPAGDFRDWPEIEAWADGIASELTGVPAGAWPDRRDGHEEVRSFHR